MKICERCTKTLPLTSFHKYRYSNDRRRIQDGYQRRCKECRRGERDTTRKRIGGLEYKCRSFLRQALGTARLEGYCPCTGTVLELMKKWTGKCAVCGKIADKLNDLHGDHCHKTGKFRGWLCQRCNTLLGRLGETEEEVLSRIEPFLHYLRET